MAMFCDLHAHSTFSDGTDTPTELVALAEEEGKSIIRSTFVWSFPCRIKAHVFLKTKVFLTKI